MELLSPAGNIEKLEYCYTYGADAAYIGLKNFSLRVKADNFYEEEYKNVIALKQKFPQKKLHCALNISFHEQDIERLKAELPYFKQYPIDAFIVQDVGIVSLLQKEFPHTALHLSTQANCINAEAAKVYKSLGFSRIVLGRETSLEEIRRIKDAVPEMEIECFVHGAMCIAYSGRCLMSAYINGRSAQEGFCSHTCRWDYDVLFDAQNAKEIAESGALVLREHKRPDEAFPIYEGEQFTAVLSSKDLCMIDHLDDLKNAGVDSLKIEGRMKSIYYVALITRAYRKALDALEEKISTQEAQPFIEELYNVSHRPFATGFYYDRANADVTVSGASESKYDLTAEVKKELSEAQMNVIFEKAKTCAQERKKEYESLVPQARRAYEARMKNQPDRYLPLVERINGWKMFTLNTFNMIYQTSSIEFIAPDIAFQKMPCDHFLLINPNTGECYSWCCHGHPCVLYTDLPITEGVLIRSFVEQAQ